MSAPALLRLWAFALMLAACAARADAPQTGLPVIELDAGGHRLEVEVAATPESRAVGLMHRRMLPEHRGMLFVFPRPAVYSMWMANTPLPLSVAFVDSNGVILNIRDMAPLTESSYSADGDALYALEMRRGWFAERGIRAGAKIGGLERAPRGR